jgi:hypothetical protein
LKWRRYYLALLAIAVLALVFAGLFLWTASAPGALVLQSHEALSEGIFSFSKSEISINATDSAGSYSFKFGLDYVENASLGSSIEAKVYGALVTEEISSSFTRAISLSVRSASLLEDGVVDVQVETETTLRGGILTESFQNPSTELSLGQHNLTVRLLVSCVDLNYIGYNVDPPQVVTLQGLFNVTQD